ncbi:MAG: hypothetical protein ACOYMS_08185, partial [Terrimicrobiaceae bacterium]
MTPASCPTLHSADTAQLHDSAPRRWVRRCFAACPMFLALQVSSAWEAPVAVPLDSNWDLVAVTGNTEGSRFSAQGAPNPRLEISYVFANVDWNSSENPDEKGRDRFKVAQK